MSQKADALVAYTIGIDAGKNTLHLIGLDAEGAIVLREKVSRGRIGTQVSECAAVLDWHRGWHGNATIALQAHLGHETFRTQPGTPL